eukprot:SAG31_NODE_2472_length_5645_cov_4.747025_3_plen_97_part_00
MVAVAALLLLLVATTASQADVQRLSPNMCADVKDRYDVDLWRRPSGSIRFPIGAWSSPIGVYSLGTPKIFAVRSYMPNICSPPPIACFPPCSLGPH